MFYIVSENGINITEAGRSPLFISKDHEEFERIKKNIRELTYNQIQEIADVKNKVVGIINEHIETSYNNDDDLEMEIEVSDNYKKDLKCLACASIVGDKDEDELSDKEKLILRLIESNSLQLVGVKLIFE